jgi:hypothetical protein
VSPAGLKLPGDLFGDRPIALTQRAGDLGQTAVRKDDLLLKRRRLSGDRFCREFDPGEVLGRGLVGSRVLDNGKQMRRTHTSQIAEAGLVRDNEYHAVTTGTTSLRLQAEQGAQKRTVEVLAPAEVDPHVPGTRIEVTFAVGTQRRTEIGRRTTVDAEMHNPLGPGSPDRRFRL